MDNQEGHGWSVEADMARLEIDSEDVHDRKKWRKNVILILIHKHLYSAKYQPSVLKRKSNPPDYKPII